MTATYKKSEKQKKESADGSSKRQYILVASTVQMTVLLCFNSKDKFTVKELSRNVGSDVGTWFIFLISLGFLKNIQRIKKLTIEKH